MNITILSDFLCPYCFIADRHLEMALDKIDFKDQVQVSHQSFQLYPNLDPDQPMGLYDMMKKIKNLSYEHVEMLLHRLEGVAEDVGLKIDYEALKYTNTFRTHRVFQYAKEEGLGNNFYKLAYRGFFSEGRVISSPEFLVDLGQRLGLDKERILQIIEDEDLYKDEVLNDIAKAYAIEVYSVPFILVNDSYGIYGGRTIESIVGLLEKVHDGSIESEDRSYKNPIKFIKKKT